MKLIREVQYLVKCTIVFIICKFFQKESLLTQCSLQKRENSSKGCLSTTLPKLLLHTKRYGQKIHKWKSDRIAWKWSASELHNQFWCFVAVILHVMLVCILYCIPLFGRIAKQFRLMEWWCPSVCLSVRPSVRPSVCLSTFWLTSVFKFVLGRINQYRLDTLHGNRPWWDLLNCDLSLWSWLSLFCPRSLNNFG